MVRVLNKIVKMISEERPVYAPFFGVMGAASAIIFSGKFQLFGLSLVTSPTILLSVKKEILNRYKCGGDSLNVS